MKYKKIWIILLTNLCYQSYGQINPLDSCGLNTGLQLNKYEIKILDSLFFPAYSTKKQRDIKSGNGFDFINKNIAFYSCTKNSNTNGNGLLSKKEFFGLCKPDFKGHAGRGIIIFNEEEKRASKGFDAVVIIDCPYPGLSNKKLIEKLLKNNE
jgi:hypothetical protein